MAQPPEYCFCLVGAPVIDNQYFVNSHWPHHRPKPFYQQRKVLFLIEGRNDQTDQIRNKRGIHVKQLAIAKNY
jgi:hypothetical protein